MRQLEEMGHCPEKGILTMDYNRCWHCVFSVKLGMTWLCVYENADGNEHEVDRLVYRLERDDKSRWAELFGTPERAARTLKGICKSCKYGDCVTCGVPEWADYSHDYDALLEWLREFTEKYQYCISDNGRSITLAKYVDEIRELLGVDE